MAQETGAPQRELLLSFIKWMNKEHRAVFCSTGYAGEMLPMGPDWEFVDQFLEQKSYVHAVPRV